jgi:hypothetical protein
MENLGRDRVKKRHVGLGVIAVMSAKGTATLAATFLLPTWPARLIALGAVLGVGTFAYVRRKRKPKHADGDRSTG